MKEAEVLSRAGDALVQCLEDVPFAQVAEIQHDVNIVEFDRLVKTVALNHEVETGEPDPKAQREVAIVDLVARLRLQDREQVLLAEVKSSGQPRLAREAAYQLARYRQLLPGGYGVFIAPFISAQAAEICRSEGVGYLDLAGNCRLAFDNVYIEKQGAENRFSAKRDLRTLYSPKAERVLRVMLSEPRRSWRLQPLAEVAQVSLGQVHNVKNVLADREWVRTSTNGITLTSPGELLTDWAQNYKYRRNTILEYYSLKPPGEIEAGIAKIYRSSNAPYALAAFSAAERWAPFLRYQRASAYVNQDYVSKIEEELNLKSVTSGANVTLWVPYDEGVFYGAEERGEAVVTSALQTYLDLSGMAGRGEEAADFLLDEVIKPTW